ncbi:MAG: ABC transporter ATP-binding protein [Caldilineaceae bacterium]
MLQSRATYRSIWITYLRPHWRQALLLLGLLLTNTGLRLYNPWLLAGFIDVAVGGGAMKQLAQLALLFLGVALVTQSNGVLVNYLAANIGLRATNRLRRDLLLHTLRLDMSFHNEHTPGELIERVDGDVGALNNFLSRFAVELTNNLLLLVGTLVMLYTIDWRVGSALLLFALLILWLTFRLRDVAVPHFTAARQAHADLYGFLEERLAGTEDVRANGATGYVMLRFYERCRALLRKDLRAHLTGSAVYQFISFSFALGTMLALGLGAYLFYGGSITIGTVYLIYRYSELLHEPIEVIGRQFQELQQAGAAILRIRAILGIQPLLPQNGQTDLPSGALAVKFDQVQFRYADMADDSRVLHDISFQLPPGSVLGLLGRTGSGKTTLARLLFRLYDPTQGAVQLNGIDLPSVCPTALRQRVSMVTQEIQLFHASLRDNLTMFEPGTSDEQIIQVLQEVGLARWYTTLPAGLETQLTPGGLSGGEAQLLAFARVFLRNPGLVILDEASSRLDPATEQTAGSGGGPLITKRTAIIIAHRLTTVQRADYIMVLDNGRCVEYGPPATGRRPRLALCPPAAHRIRGGACIRVIG